MRATGDFHMHTKASDGSATVKENAAAAIEAGLETIAITDHSFTNTICHLTRQKFDAQSAETAAVNAEGKIRVLHGVEGNLINGSGEMDVPDDVIRRCDVLHLGFHRFLSFKNTLRAFGFVIINGFAPSFIRKCLIKINTQAYLNAMNTYPIDVLVHLNHRATVDTKKVCEAAVSKGIYIELNEKHIGTLEKDIDIVMASGVNFILGSDAHKAKRVGKFTKVEQFIARHNIPAERIYGLGKMPAFKDKSGWKK